VPADGVSVEDSTIDPDARVRDLAAEAGPSTADVLVVLAGSNDVAFATSNDDVELALQRLVDRTQVPRVLLASIPPGARQPQKTADFNDLLSRIAYRHDWSFVNASADLVARDCAYRPRMTLDGVRPSEAGAKAIAEAVRGALTTRTDLDPAAP
jgi:lysophospholipase L1-like esterase